MKQTNKLKRTPSCHIFHLPFSSHTCSDRRPCTHVQGLRVTQQPDSQAIYPNPQGNNYTRLGSRADRTGHSWELMKGLLVK